MTINPKPRGGKRPGAGRKPGVRDKATVEQKATLGELARTYTEAALATLYRVCTKSESDSAATAAAIALLDRGYGRPSQSVEVGGDPENPIQTVTRIERAIIDPRSEDAADRDAESIPTAH